MSDPITIRLEGPPRGKGRHHARIVTPRGRAPFVQEYPDAKTVRYEGSLSAEARLVMANRAPLTGELVVVIYAFMPIPTSWPKWKRRDAANRLIRPATKPDWDNIAKVCDALNGIVWGDDASVVDGSVRKFYSEAPELVVTIEPWVPELPAAVSSRVAVAA